MLAPTLSASRLFSELRRGEASPVVEPTPRGVAESEQKRARDGVELKDFRDSLAGRALLSCLPLRENTPVTRRLKWV